MNNNIKSGIMYFYIHFVTEVICFFTLYRYTGTRPEMWILYLSYDMLAFVPQGVIGFISDRFPRIPLGSAGLLVMASSTLLFKHASNPFLSLVVLCVGNCLVHVNGAETTLRTSEGKLSGSAIFVSGGSFGVVTGRLLAKTGCAFWPVVLLVLSAVPLTLFAQRYVNDETVPYSEQCKKFNYTKPGVASWILIVLAVVIVAVRGFMGYGIPTSWNKSSVQTVFLFIFMGAGKALGGIAADHAGFRKTAMISVVVAAPFLMAGDHFMAVSLVGVMLFSMTMAITLGLLVSVIPRTPGLAFGLTTIGLFLGTMPVFFFKFVTVPANCIMIAVLSCLCLGFMQIIIRKDLKDE